MPKVKILIVSGCIIDYDAVKIISHGIEDWEFVTQEEYEFLRSNLWRIQGGHEMILLRQDDVSISTRISDIKDIIDDLAKKERAAKEERERRKQEEATKRAGRSY